jgi:Methyltransferase domain
MAFPSGLGCRNVKVASDRDPRFLDEFAGPGREVLTHDIVSGPVPPGDFDFAHCRAVLAHVTDLSATVCNVMASVRPGGWVMCEEADYGSLEPCDPDHPRASDFATFRSVMTEAGLLDSFAGRNTHRSLRNAGLGHITTDIHSAVAVGGSLRALYRIHSMQHVRSRIVDSGFCSEVAFSRMLDVFADPSFEYIDNFWIATWGRTPE